jgi:hypothetical protein
VSFSAEWLSLREPFDVRARNPVVMNAVIGAFKSTLSQKLTAKQDWRLVDYDRALLARASESAAGLNAQVEMVAADLNRELEQVLDRPADLVTNSALFDLVSEDWIERLVDSAARRKLSVYAALNYDACGEPTPVRRQRLRSCARSARGGSGNCQIHAARFLDRARTGGLERLRAGSRVSERDRRRVGAGGGRNRHLGPEGHRRLVVIPAK